MTRERLMNAMTLEELQEIYAEELARKDRVIEQLREENEVLMRTALKRTEERIDINERIGLHLHNHEKQRDERAGERKRNV